MKGIGSQREREYKESLVIARTQAWLTGLASRVKTLPGSPEKLIQFVWEEEKVQSPEDMKSFLLSFAKNQNAWVKNKKKLRTTPPVKMKRTKNTK